METNRIEKKPEYRKVPLSIEADDALERMVKGTNQGFTGGKIGKAEILSWLVRQFEQHTFESAKEVIRQTYFDRVAYLSSLIEEVRTTAKSGGPEPDWETLLAPVVRKN